MPYIVGVSSGAFTVTGQEERSQLIGLFKKAQTSITKGVQFIQLDLESLAEFKEPDLIGNIEKIRGMGIRFGLHSETAAFGIEMSEPDSAIQIDYENSHRRLYEILQDSNRIGVEYVLIHSSESIPFPLLGRSLQPAVLVDIWGRPLRDFIEKEKDDWVMKWILPDDQISGGASFIWSDLIGGRNLKEYYDTDKEEYIRSLEYQALKEKGMSDDEIFGKRNEYITKRLRDFFLGFIESRSHHYGPERYAYYVIAKWMERENDPLWNDIIEANINFYAKYDSMTPEEWKDKMGIRPVNGKWSIEDPKFREEQHKLWVPAVSAKYIWGHFNQDKCEGAPFRNRDLREQLKVRKKDGTEHVMPLVLESPMAHRGTEEWLRLPNPLQMYYLAKEINEKAGFQAVALALDLEHMISIRVDPEKMIELLPENGGKYVRVIHAGWPAPIAPAHLPIQLGSEQQAYLYRVYYKLRQKGFGKEPGTDDFIIFERGGPETFIESILSLRQIVNLLNQDVPPEHLHEHPEFFGIATGEVSSEERQRAIIKEHFFDPLEGLITTPEEKYSFLGKAATEKGKSPEQWKKEELT